MIQHICRTFFALVALVGLWTRPVGAAFGEHDSNGHMLALLVDDEVEGEDEGEGEDEDGIHQEGELFVDGDEESHDEDGDEEDHDEESGDEDGIHQEGE